MQRKCNILVPMFRLLAGLLLVAVVAGAGIKAGPRVVIGPNGDRIVGADPLDPDCNGTSKGDSFNCNKGCGNRYDARKPVLKGGVQDERWENSFQVCDNMPPPMCPVTYQETLQNPTNCIATKAGGGGEE